MSGLLVSPGGSVVAAGSACRCGAVGVALSSAGLCWACAPRCPRCFRPVGFAGLRGACACSAPAPSPAPPPAAAGGLPAGRSVAFSAFRSGSLASVAFRPASWSRSVLVAVLGFRSPASAGRFAARWARRLGVAVPVRRSGRLWAVGVPVAGVPSGLSHGVWVRGGLRGLVCSLGVLVCASPDRVRLFGGVSSGV